MGTFYSNKDYKVIETADGFIIERKCKFNIKQWAEDKVRCAEENSNVSFHFDGKFTVCFNKRTLRTGFAMCRSTDDFDSVLGRAIAYCRCVGKKIPDEILSKSVSKSASTFDRKKINKKIYEAIDCNDRDCDTCPVHNARVELGFGACSEILDEFKLEEYSTPELRIRCKSIIDCKTVDEKFKNQLRESGIFEL